MTTPAQDAPLVFPSVAFRPLRLLLMCLALTAVAVDAAAALGHLMVRGVLRRSGLAWVCSTPSLVQRSVESITAKDASAQTQDGDELRHAAVGDHRDRADDRVHLPAHRVWEWCLGWRCSKSACGDDCVSGDEGAAETVWSGPPATWTSASEIEGSGTTT